jgi:hypothetical protein
MLQRSYFGKNGFELVFIFILLGEGGAILPIFQDRKILGKKGKELQKPNNNNNNNNKLSDFYIWFSVFVAKSIEG